MRAHLLYDVQRVGLVVPAADPEHAVSSVHCSVALRPYAVRSGGQHPCPKKIDVAVGVPCHLLQGCSVVPLLGACRAVAMRWPSLNAKI